ncbi:PREDICTED: uncharacterized protein LOC108561663 [Nicrophorus vespilloides]|uniref:Uncharacterized protein LOC108561663 n=1 Tax=Nicrophorus vespilloides TaxID=110193 RepID=A0ABM1MKT7_NICVS|nr:PREDICTED: uncharacterized protein LOC108561663 [Nicrophorus vespilloides]
MDNDDKIIELAILRRSSSLKKRLLGLVQKEINILENIEYTVSNKNKVQELENLINRCNEVTKTEPVSDDRLSAVKEETRKKLILEKLKKSENHQFLLNVLCNTL